ncbi:MAG TPA: S8 family serine peptidase [Methanospirillum sp.]|nr:S8 family serine peptidase [Methanospirillum sp.]
MGSVDNLNRICRWSNITPLVLAIFIFLSIPAWSLAEPNETEIIRMILYTPEVGSYSQASEALLNATTIADNLTVIYRSHKLGFVVVDVPKNNSVKHYNDLLLVPGADSVMEDPFRVPCSLYEKINDPLYTKQWELTRVNIPKAWNLISGNRTVRVGLIDTGVDSENGDLQGIIEQKGYNWVENNTDTQDHNGHGTALAGIIGAVTGNGRGMAGVAKVSIIPESVGDQEVGIYASSSALAICHAADAGAQIIMIGYGGPIATLAEDRAVKYAAAKGCIMVAPAGNGGNSEQNYPSDFFEVISVGSTTNTDGLSVYSNFGIYMDLVAPGELLYSIYPNNQISPLRGTSPSAALVAGTAALILEANPSLNASQVREILCSTAKDLGKTGRDIHYGSGLLDAEAAVRKAINESSSSSHLEISKDMNLSVGYNNSSLQTEIDDIKELPPLTVKRASLGVNITAIDLLLYKGWNFVSLPSMLRSGKNTGEVFKGINTDGHTIWKYHADKQDWTAVLQNTRINPFEGFLIYSDRTTAVPLVFTTENKTPSRVHLSAGWNLIGSPYPNTTQAKTALSSVSEQWVSLLAFNASHQAYDPAIINGASGRHSDQQLLPPMTAYWVFMNQAGELTQGAA